MLILNFSFVHFDGPHMTKDVLTEAIWFANRSAPHTRFVFDDTERFEMSVVAYALTFFDFKTIEMGGYKMFIGEKTIVILMLLTLLALTTGCRNYDFNPTTTIVRMIYDSSKKMD